MATKKVTPAVVRPQSKPLSDLARLRQLEHEREQTLVSDPIRELRKKLRLPESDSSSDLLDSAFGTDEPINRLAAVRAIVRNMADLIDVVTHLGNDPLNGTIANGFARVLEAADADLDHAMRWIARERAESVSREAVRQAFENADEVLEKIGAQS
jgi:hypothetical protein